MKSYPGAVQTGIADLDLLTEQIAIGTTETRTDCYVVVISLINTVSRDKEEGKIVRQGVF